MKRKTCLHPTETRAENGADKDQRLHLNLPSQDRDHMLLLRLGAGQHFKKPLAKDELGLTDGSMCLNTKDVAVDTDSELLALNLS